METQGLSLLRQPFPPHQISKLPKPKSKDSPKGRCAECGGWHGLPAVHLDYVGHAALTDRLLDADPAWTWEPLALGPDGLPVLDPLGGLWIKLTVCGVTRLGYGHAADKSGGDAIKEIIGDALRNAAMRFGAALDLWHKGDLHVAEEEPKKPAGFRATDPVVESIPPDERAYLRELAAEAETVFAMDGAAATVRMIKAKNLDHEQKIGLWSYLLPKTRRAIKEEEEAQHKVAKVL